MPLMNQLEAAAADPLLGLMLAVREDPRAEKVDLGVGIYKDQSGSTPVMAAVKQAEDHLLREQRTKAYEGPHGDPVFCAQMTNLVLGEQTERHVGFATPGGSGALFIGLRLASRASPGATVWISDPNWPNHVGIAKSLGMPVEFYPYATQADGSADLGQIKDGLKGARAGDVVLLQGPCHNPTGTDLSADAWGDLAAMISERGLLPFVDIAYQGFGRGLEEDVAPIRSFLANLPEAIVSVSCSKNFGLYRERTGFLLLQAENAAALDAARSQTASIIRTSYSMPPAHGAAVAGIILDDAALRNQWSDELNSMRERLTNLRQMFASALVRETNDDRFMTLADQKGMFSMLPLSAEETLALQKEHAIYMPKSGRVNIAGLGEDTVDPVARAIAPMLAR